jgi:hypothetical protein
MSFFSACLNYDYIEKNTNKNLLDDNHKKLWLNELIEMTCLNENEILEQIEYIIRIPSERNTQGSNGEKGTINICWNDNATSLTIKFLNKIFNDIYDLPDIKNYHNDNWHTTYSESELYIKKLNINDFNTKQKSLKHLIKYLMNNKNLKYLVDDSLEF